MYVGFQSSSSSAISLIQFITSKIQSKTPDHDLQSPIEKHTAHNNGEFILEKKVEQIKIRIGKVGHNKSDERERVHSLQN
jgi:ATP-dependent Lon protease